MGARWGGKGRREDNPDPVRRAAYDLKPFCVLVGSFVASAKMEQCPNAHFALFQMDASSTACCENRAPNHPHTRPLGPIALRLWLLLARPLAPDQKGWLILPGCRLSRALLQFASYSPVLLLGGPAVGSIFHACSPLMPQFPAV